MTEKTKRRKELAQLITDTIFFVDPYNGADEDEITKYNNEDLRTLEGCYEIIEQLCNMLKEA